MTLPKECPKCGLLMTLAERVEENPSECAVCYMKRPRHYHDAPTIREMLDKMEEKRTCDAPCLVAMLRVAVATLEELDDQDDNRARKALESIERGLWATSPRELWFETPDSESLGGGGLWKGENASPKEATDNDELCGGGGGSENLPAALEKYRADQRAATRGQRCPLPNRTHLLRPSRRIG